ncbi:MAG TPA: sigma-70 family RNA polymerase sigma factor, partial [Longimicrobiales bacterium]|nr:sigma-70 family RNA polymerase sigma factor [Longimicrobiales bacterium]
MQPEVERELIRKCRSGDPRYYEPLVRAYEGPALRVATGILGDRGRARDAVQDAFVRAWDGLDGFDRDRPFAPWFFRILRNRCRDLARQQAARDDREKRAVREAADGLREDGRRRQERREAREAV